MVVMACCKCCCGGVDCSEGQEGRCCCGGIYGTCCQVGEYCCSGVCQAGPCCSGACDDDLDCPTGCVCVAGECVAAGDCCFKNVGATHSFTFQAYSGTVSLGSWTGGGGEYLSIYCTTGVVVCGSTVGDGVFFQFYDGTDYWEGVSLGNALTYPCASRTSLAGTYTLTNCTTSATATLTIT